MHKTDRPDNVTRARQMLADVRASLPSAENHPGEAALRQLDALEQSLARVLAEHEGMADELLQVYEQISTVFELPRRLATVADENEVPRLFADSLSSTYRDWWVKTVWPDADGALTACGDDVLLRPWIQQALEQCRSQHGVIVADAPQPASRGLQSARTEVRGSSPCHPELIRVLCGPIYAGDALVCAVLLGQLSLGEGEDQPRAFKACDMRLVDSLNAFCGDTIRNFRLLQEVRQLSVDAVRALISAVDQKDEYTSGHSTRVGIYAVMLGKELGLDTATLQMLEWSALLHDVGKIGIRDDVLKKPGRLTEEEFKHIQEHPVRSGHIVREIPQLADALSGVTHHHEHWDGRGYPDGLAGEQIPLQARIIQVADIFDALTSTRSYREAFDWPKALAILNDEAGTTVDPRIRAVFDRMIRRLFEENPRRFHEIARTGRQGPPVDATSDGDGQVRAADGTCPDEVGSPRGLKSAARRGDRQRERRLLR